jgi:serine/threonine protein kinase
MEQQDIDVRTILESKLQEYGVKIIDKNDLQIEKPNFAEGGFGKVYKGKYQTNIDVAIKKLHRFRVDKNELPNRYVVDMLKNIINEIHIVSMVKNPSFPIFHGVCINKSVLFVFEYIDGEVLNKCYTNFDFHTKLEIMKQLTKVLSDLHTRKIIHRDIKPANVMIEHNSNKVRVIDFGISRIFQNTITFTANENYTINYTAPEAIDPLDSIKGSNKLIVISPKIDVWSIGCIISQIYSEIVPWRNVCRTDPPIIKKLLQKVEFPIPDIITDERIKYLIRKACTIDYKERPTSKEFLDLINNVIDGKEISPQ